MGDALPPGVILMWAGALADIPDGWALCDGDNNTPDLRGRFVRGVDSSNPGTVGGADQYSLSVDELPSHSHGVTDPGHAHGVQRVSNSGNVNGVTGLIHNGVHQAFTTSLLSTSSSTTGISLASTGGGAAFDKRPAYYEVAYIMKL